MSDPVFITNASQLSPAELLLRLKTLYDGGTMSDTEQGIYRQIEARGLKSLSEKQRWHLEENMIPKCVERCSFKGCNDPTSPGKTYCDTHDIEFGEHP